MNNKIKQLENDLNAMIQDFVFKKIAACAFESRYASIWRKYRNTNELTSLNKQTNSAYDRIFTTLDCYCADPELRDDEDLDDEALYNEIKKMYLEIIASNSDGAP